VIEIYYSIKSHKHLNFFSIIFFFLGVRGGVIIGYSSSFITYQTKNNADRTMKSIHRMLKKTRFGYLHISCFSLLSIHHKIVKILIDVNLWKKNSNWSNSIFLEKGRSTNGPLETLCNSYPDQTAERSKNYALKY